MHVIQTSGQGEGEVRAREDILGIASIHGVSSERGLVA